MKAPLQLLKVELQNVRSLKHVELDFSANAKLRAMTVLIGKNGSGKSSILRAMAIGLCPQREASSLVSKLTGSVIRKNKKGNLADVASILIDLCDPHQPETIFRIETYIQRDASGQEFVSQNHTPEVFPWDRIFVCGYGVNRGSSRYESISTFKHEEAVQTLFVEDAGLLDPEGELRRLKLASYEAPEKEEKYLHTLKILRKLLRLENAAPIEVTSEGVLIHGPWAPMPFHALGDGYRGTAGWILDLLGRYAIGGFGVSNQGPAGIVLIDEVDEHLHPGWQKEVVLLLKKLLPQVQFICTTHSPMTIVNNDQGEVYACTLKNAVGSVTPMAAPTGKNADDILKGEWFGLKTTLDHKSEKMILEYLKAVKNDRSGAQTHQLEREIRHRLGYMVTTPLEEAAMKVVLNARGSIETMSEEEQQQALQDAFQEW